jgi:predicted RNA-binding Zn ribbon-like protein
MPAGRSEVPADLDLVRDFVNTLDVEARSDAFAAPGGVVEWASSRGLWSTDEENIGERDRARVTELREALRGLLRANAGAMVDDGALATLNRCSISSRIVLRFDDGGRARLDPAAGGVEALLGQVLAAVYRAQAEGLWPRLKVCAEDTCRWAFYDSSKNRSKTWCSMASCGNRAKSRTYRRRRT